MISVEQQVHGYRQGHQLLSSSVSLSRTDQSTVDQLSDVAGPLRPGELFAPYLSAYPLPSGTFYVLARTWQDLTVPRAGCVRTLSLLIPMADWVSAVSLLPLLRLLDATELPTSADRSSLGNLVVEALPPVENFRGNELLEALFLEEAKPVAVFDAPDSELIAIRLITSLWPGIKSCFSLSTFALSPRKIEGRFFNLVFAPKDAKPRFTDWPGRRIDARLDRDSRHRWTGTIFSRVFLDPYPKLMNNGEGGLAETNDDDSLASLRIALLWDELYGKLERSPSAALGLLDIANSRLSVSTETTQALIPLLRDATSQALTELRPSDAWDFVGAIVRKMHGVYSPMEIQLVSAAAIDLAKQDPVGALELLSRPDPDNALEILAPLIGTGMGANFEDAENALAVTAPTVLARMISVGGELARVTARSSLLLSALARAIPSLSQEELLRVRLALLPWLIDDDQLAILEPLINTLDVEEILDEVGHLGKVNDFRARSFFRPITARARQLEAIIPLRHLLLHRSPSEGRDRFFTATLAPSHEDVHWLLTDPILTIESANGFLITLLRSASSIERKTLLHDQRVLDRVPDEGADLLLWAVQSIDMPLDAYLATVTRLLPFCDENMRVQVATAALERSLPCRFQGDELAIIGSLLEAASSLVDVSLVARAGLNSFVASDVLNRNIVAIEAASLAVRSRFIEGIDAVAEALSSRYALEFSLEGAARCASLLWAAHSQNAKELTMASGMLLPKLFHSKESPVSIMVAATFPIVYAELASQGEVPDLLKFVPFMDWDKCKAARRELVDAFLSSSVWAPEDLALTAYLSQDLDRILGRVARSYGGPNYLDQMLARSAKLPDQCRKAVEASIDRVRRTGSF